MKVAVVGTGYVGLVTAVGLAKLGNEVIGVDKDINKIDMLGKGKLPIYEPGLNELFLSVLEEGKLDFSTDIGAAVRNSDVIFICVGTPSLDDGTADLSQVEEVARTVSENLDGYKLIVEKSTVPVNTARWIKRTIELYNKGKRVDFDVASNPEFLREGKAVYDFFHPDRIVIGVDSKRAENMLLELYAPVNAKILVTDIPTAELIKHASNSFLAMKISFINMISDLCDKTGADVKMVADGMGLDSRIGRAFLDAGLGYGGSCFPKDTRALFRIGEGYHLDFELLKVVDRINLKRIEKFIDKLKDALWVLKDKVVAVWGLSFKPDTDDIREAPSIKIIKELLKEDAHLRLYDPKAMENMKRLFPPDERVEYVDDMYSAVDGAHALLVVAEWGEFKDADLSRVASLMKTPVVVDGRNIFEPGEMAKYGIFYCGMGRGKSV
ncbi:MAG: UDP-glucose/GDP-mannose dehydrogenase family protein [Synergistetes bacterium]|nr:UDP-glucose/GDP-mannose dehydrogenase family protein [Synergistota bacterium]